MNLDRVEIEALAKAFPTDHDGRHVCAWCGKSRRSHDALCRACWHNLSDHDQRHYISLGLSARAAWIASRIPKEKKP